MVQDVLHNSSAGDFQADGERTGEYILAGEELTLNEHGESIISYAENAIAMVDEIIGGQSYSAENQRSKKVILRF